MPHRRPLQGERHQTAATCNYAAFTRLVWRPYNNLHFTHSYTAMILPPSTRLAGSVPERGRLTPASSTYIDPAMHAVTFEDDHCIIVVDLNAWQRLRVKRRAMSGDAKR